MLPSFLCNCAFWSASFMFHLFFYLLLSIFLKSLSVFWRLVWALWFFTTQLIQQLMLLPHCFSFHVEPFTTEIAQEVQSKSVSTVTSTQSNTGFFSFFLISPEITSWHSFCVCVWVNMLFFLLNSVAQQTGIQFCIQSWCRLALLFHFSFYTINQSALPTHFHWATSNRNISHERVWKEGRHFREFLI